MTDKIMQAEIAALMEEYEKTEAAMKEIATRYRAILDRVEAGAKVEPGYYGVYERQLMGQSMGMFISAGVPRKSLYGLARRGR